MKIKIKGNAKIEIDLTSEDTLSFDIKDNEERKFQKDFSQWYEENAILIEDYEKIMNTGTEEEKERVKGMIQIGVFQNEKKPGFFEQYNQMVQKLIEKDEAQAGRRK